MLRVLTFLAVTALPGAGAGIAQETTSALGAGGLVLARTAQVTIEKKVLSIGLGGIKATYTFRNGGEKDETFLLTFPMPEVDGGDLIETPVRFPKSDPVNFLDFAVTVDGKPITPRVEQRAFGLGLDVTGLLKGDKIPLNPSAAEAGRTLALLAGRRKDEYARQGLAVFESAESVFPLWTVTTIAYWDQVFPVGKEVTVTLAYKPVTGEVPLTRDVRKEDLSLDDYCMDDDAWNALATRVAARNEPLTGFEVQYVLTAGAGWMGPIKSFELTIEKPDPNATVALCLDEGKTSGLRIEYEGADFVPEQDLKIFFVPGKR